MAVLKIAKSGGDAETDAEKDLVMTSDRPCIIEFMSGTIDIATNGVGYGTAEITHGLGYRPGYYCFIRDALSTGDWYPQLSGYPSLLASVDTNKLYLIVNYEQENTTYKVHYTIWANQQNNAEGTGNDNVTGRLRIAKDGYDAETETDLRNMKFASGKNVYKIDSTLSGSVTSTIATDDITIITINHNLGYVPMAFVLASTFGQMLPSSVFAFPAFSYWITSTQIKIEVADFSGDTPYPATFKYKILRDKLA